MLYPMFIYITCSQCSSGKPGYDNQVSVKLNASDTPATLASVGCCYPIAVEIEAQNV